MLFNMLKMEMKLDLPAPLEPDEDGQRAGLKTVQLANRLEPFEADTLKLDFHIQSSSRFLIPCSLIGRALSCAFSIVYLTLARLLPDLLSHRAHVQLARDHARDSGWRGIRANA